MQGRVAYVPQQAWLINATLKYNICFAKPYEKKRYDKILEACALLPDLKVLPAGDATEIGEKVIVLSILSLEIIRWGKFLSFDFIH